MCPGRDMDMEPSTVSTGNTFYLQRTRRYFWAGKSLERLRTQAGITQEECAKRCCYNVRVWRRIAAGEMRPPRERLIQRILIDALECRELDTVNKLLRFFDYAELGEQDTITSGLHISDLAREQTETIGA